MYIKHFRNFCFIDVSIVLVVMEFSRKVFYILLISLASFALVLYEQHWIVEFSVNKEKLKSVQGDKSSNEGVKSCKSNNLQSILEFFKENISTFEGSSRHISYSFAGKTMRNSLLGSLPSKIQMSKMQQKVEVMLDKKEHTDIYGKYNKLQKLTTTPILHQTKTSLNKTEIRTQSVNDTKKQHKHLAYSNYKQESTGILRFTQVSCEQLHPQILLYNRIFKTGSSSLERYLSNISEQTGTFDLYQGTTEDWYNGEYYTIYPDFIEYKAQNSTNMSFIAHFYFRKRLSISKSYTYINMLREPVERVISHYNYMRLEHIRPKERVEELRKSGQWNETLLECIKKQHRGCENNVMTRFFCGTKSYCKRGTLKSLKRAKFNMSRYYASVGILEEVHTFIKILQKRLPSYFNANISSKIKFPKLKENYNKGYVTKYGNDIKSYILKQNKADYYLYQYALKRFNLEKKACGL